MISADFEKQLRANLRQSYPVVITLQPDASDASVKSIANLQPFEGLTGIYKASLTGEEILHLGQKQVIQSIEPDDITFHTQ